MRGDLGNMASWITAALYTLSLYTLTKAATTVAPPGDAAAAAAANVTATTVAPSFSFSISQVNSDTSYIEIAFDTIAAEFTIEQYIVTAQKKDSDSLIISPVLNSTMAGYKIEDLMTDSEYEVCATITVSNTTDSFEEKACLSEWTIPLIRPDSLYILFIVLGYFIIMILIGIICWKCKMKQLEDDEEGDEEEKAPMENNHHAPPPRPHSPIEDNDIPYITPPFDQLSPDEKRNYRKSQVV